MAISIIDNFKINAKLPIDSRTSATNSNNRDAVPYKYDGLKVFQLDTRYTYTWNQTKYNTSGVTSSSWDVDMINTGFGNGSVFSVPFWGTTSSFLDSSIVVSSVRPNERYQRIGIGGSPRAAFQVDGNYSTSYLGTPSNPFVIEKAPSSTILGDNWYLQDGSNYSFNTFSGSSTIDFNNGSFIFRGRTASSPQGVLNKYLSIKPDIIETTLPLNIGGTATFGNGILTSGNISAAAWGISGINIQAPQGGYYDTTTPANTTVSYNMVNSFGASYLSSVNSNVVYTHAATIYIAGGPRSGSATVINSWALYVNSGYVYIGAALLIGSNNIVGSRILQVTGDTSLTGLLNVGRLSTFNGGIITSGNISSVAWGTNGVNFKTSTAGFSDTSSAASSTVAFNAINSFGNSYLGANNSGVTYTNAATVYIASGPSTGNVTVTNSWALYVDSGYIYSGGALLIGSNIVSGPSILQVTGNTTLTGNLSTSGLATFNGGILTTGVISTAAWGVNGINLQTHSSTYIDTSSLLNSVVANNMINSFGIPNLQATNGPLTYTNASTVYIAGAPTGGSVIITNAYSLYVGGGNVFSINSAGRVFMGASGGVGNAVVNAGVTINGGIFQQNGYSNNFTNSSFTNTSVSANNAITITNNPSGASQTLPNLFGATIISTLSNVTSSTCPVSYTLALTTPITLGAGTTLTTAYVLSIATNTVATNNISLQLYDAGNAAPTGNWSIYNSATASNYFAGKILLGSNVVSGSSILQVTGNTSLTGTLSINTDHAIELYGSNPYIGFTGTGTQYWQIGKGINSSINDFVIYSSTTGINSLQISSTTMRVTLYGNLNVGGVTTSASFIKTGGTALQALAANGSVITFGSGLTLTSGLLTANSNNSIVSQTFAPTNSGATTLLTFTTPSVANYHNYRISGNINITSISTNVLALQVTYTDYAGIVRTQTFFPMGSTSSSLSAIADYIFPAVNILSNYNTAITVKTILTTSGGTVTYTASAFIEDMGVFFAP